MKARLGALDGIKAGKAAPLAATFHGFGLRIVRDTVDGAQHGTPGRHRRTAPGNAGAAGRDAAGGFHRHRAPRAGSGPAGAGQSSARREAGHGAEARLEPQRQEILTQVAQRDAQQKRSQNAWEFSDMLFHALTLLDSFPERKEDHARYFRHIVVDEFQDHPADSDTASPAGPRHHGVCGGR